MQAGYPEVVSSEISNPGRRRCQHIRKARRTCAASTAMHMDGPAESKTPRMHRNFTRENRETPSPSAASRERTAGRKR
jgi:hypothetical protein